MGFGILIFQLFAQPIVEVFQLSPEFTSLCVRAIRIITCGFVFAGVNVLLQGICQAMGGGVQSLVISMLRLVVFVLPLAAIFANFAGAEQFIWVVFPIAEFITLIIAIILTLRLYQQTTAEM